MLLSTTVLALGGVAACEEDSTLVQPPGGPRPVRSVRVEPSSQQLHVGQRLRFTARVTPDSVASTAVRWSTSDAAVVTADSATGEVTAVGPGSALVTATLTATAGPTRTGSASVLVAGRGVNGITATPSALTLTQGTTQTLGVTVDAAPGVARTVTCTSSAPAVAATATAAGGATCTVTAASVGSATITFASTVDPTMTAAVRVVVAGGGPDIAGISVDPSTIRLLAGEEQLVTATITTANNTAARTVTPVSSNAAVVRAVVAATGAGAAGASTLIRLDGLGPGAATVTVCWAEQRNVFAQIGVTVAPR